ncbi:hypothetical protein ACFPVS_00580 [Neisseria weixii]|uniref:hypothetical protein n=1 Tax=Neisseria weixii TaxID=1853276 RepID=UPI0018DFE633|nr:hypothetical protein [Neisseria weixii]
MKLLHKGMERSDLLNANAAIFKTQGEALNKVTGREIGHHWCAAGWVIQHP